MTRSPDPFKQMDNERKEFEKISNSNVRKAEKMSKQLDKERKDRDEFMRRMHKLETRQAERQQRTKDLQYAAEALDEHHASPRSRRIVLTGLNEYYRIVHPHSEPEPESTLDQVASGLLLSEIVEQPVAWLWQDYLPLGALTLLEGEPGSGTSLLALHIAACVTSGRSLPGDVPGTQGTVILVAGQDHIAYTIKPRFLAAGGDPARVLMLTTVEQVDSEKVTIEDRPFSLARDLCFLEEAVARTHAALVILDSLDTCRPTELRQALPALAQLAQRSGCAILLVCPLAAHQPATAPKPGSLELQRAVRSCLRILSDPEDTERQRLLVVTKHALCAQPAILSFQLTPNAQGILTLDWLGSYTRPTPPYQDGDFPPLSSRNRTVLHRRIVSALESSAAPLNARSLTTITGFNYELVRKTLQRMFDKRDLVCPARGLYTTPGHSCLEQHIPPTGTPPAEPALPPDDVLTPHEKIDRIISARDPGERPANRSPFSLDSLPDPTVPAEPPPAAAQATPAKPSDPIVLTNPAAPVSNVSITPITPATPDPAHNHEADPQTAPVPSVSTVPTRGSSQLSATTLTAPDDLPGEWENDSDQQNEPGYP